MGGTGGRNWLGLTGFVFENLRQKEHPVFVQKGAISASNARRDQFGMWSHLFLSQRAFLYTPTERNLRLVACERVTSLDTSEENSLWQTSDLDPGLQILYDSLQRNGFLGMSSFYSKNGPTFPAWHQSKEGGQTFCWVLFLWDLSWKLNRLCSFHETVSFGRIHKDMEEECSFWSWLLLEIFQQTD